MKSTPLGPFLGVNNRLPDFGLHVQDKGDFVRAAVNVDLTNAGTFKRRPGAVLVQAMTGPHSLHNGLMVRSAALYAVTLPTYSETLLAVLAADTTMSYVEYAASTYYSNGTDSGRVSGGVCYPWALPTPVSPRVSTVSGSLDAGWYQVATAYANSTTGEEGGVSPSANYNLSGGGGLRVTLPGPTAGADHVNVYVSTVNGSNPFLHATVPAGDALLDVTTLTLGREAVQRYEAPLPAGRLFLFNGCLCSFKDGNVYEGLPYRPGYYLPAEGRIPFPGIVSNVVPAQNGVYVVADKTYWLQGPRMTQVETIQDVLPYGGVPGTEFSSPNKALYGWFGDRGIVLGTPKGEAQAIMSDNVDVVPPAAGVSSILESGGYRRVVSCGYCLNLDNLGVTTYQGWGFTSTSGEFGTMADGVYQISDAAPVDATVELGRVNFGMEAYKQLVAIYLGVESDAKLRANITTPAGDVFGYLARGYSQALRIQRVDTGRGLRSNWYNIAITNTEGCAFSLASVSFVPPASSRRI